MAIRLNDDQKTLQDGIKRLCNDFGDDYWLARDNDGHWPEEFVKTIAASGWLGICMPTKFGGAGLGVYEAAIVMQTISRSGGGFAAASSIHINLFGPQPIVQFGTKEQQERMLPGLISGTERMCFGVTEPNAGLDTGAIQTKAVRKGDEYIISGQKIWTSTAKGADKIMLLARTSPRIESGKSTDGLTLFHTNLNRDQIEIREIAKMGRKAVDSNALFIDDLHVPIEDRIGEEGSGFKYLLHGLNPERILIGAEAIGIGYAALEKAVNYATEREVFGRAIGKNQAIQHPLADSWMKLEAANLLVFEAARLFDSGEACGAEANAAKYLGAEASHESCERAILTHGGMGYAKEYHVERYLRESYIARIAPVSREMILNYISERVLKLPRSY
ncbi:MAG: acyl-CoA dehydrogenase [Alphaproteobacteria bacterium]|nr:acyl-CoA dehydrogenase [Alphaproteobacteria bacterium]|tara:strand:- start:367 stop:1533 length:1167 start_codon:yes stop_codon:yes gene_type:complete